MRRSTETPLGALLGAIERELPAAIELRHRLHSNPELAYAEHETAEAVSDALPVASETVAQTGRVALIADDGRAPVAVRSELDGLPITEHTGAPFTATGQIMHACGHDVHMAALVALTRAAHSLAEQLPAPLMAIFQPSEEAHPSGAELLIRGELPRTPQAIVAAHIHPELPWGSVALDPGTVNASCDTVTITVEGEPAHGAYPHLGRDPILALCEIVASLHAQVSRRIDPLQSALITIGTLQGGSAENVIPERAQARGALRAYRGQERLALRTLVGEVAEHIASAHRCVARVEIAAGEPPLHNDARIVEEARGLLKDAGLALAAPWRSAGSDDFSFFGELGPIAMGFVGLAGAEGFKTRPLHHPELLVADEAVGAVARTQAALYLAAASSLGGASTSGGYDAGVPERLYFTESEEANELIAKDPMALLIGFVLDQQVSVQKAFCGPLELLGRLGSLDAAKLASVDLEPIFREKPAIHRFPGTMAKRVGELAEHILEHYRGDAARVWSEAKNGDELRANLQALPGFGEMKVKSLGTVLAKRYGLQIAGELVPSHPTLGDVDSLQALGDYQAAKRANKARWSQS